jgi:hypothetical protein
MALNRPGRVRTDAAAVVAVGQHPAGQRGRDRQDARGEEADRDRRLGRGGQPVAEDKERRGNPIFEIVLGEERVDGHPGAHALPGPETAVLGC